MAISYLGDLPPTRLATDPEFVEENLALLRCMSPFQRECLAYVAHYVEGVALYLTYTKGVSPEEEPAVWGCIRLYTARVADGICGYFTSFTE